METRSLMNVEERHRISTLKTIVNAMPDSYTVTGCLCVHAVNNDLGVEYQGSTEPPLLFMSLCYQDKTESLRFYS